MIGFIVIVLLVVIVRQLHVLGSNLIDETPLEIPEQRRHEHLHLLHRRKK